MNSYTYAGISPKKGFWFNSKQYLLFGIYKSLNQIFKRTPLKKSPGRIIVEAFSKPLYKLVSSNVREWEYKDLKILVLPGVFHPGWFVTSHILLEYLEEIDVADKNFLELGCGTGTQACRAAKRGANSYASDVAEKCVRNAELNAERNEVTLGVMHSDLFDQMPETLSFDWIFVNPPFVAKYPENEEDFAFFCGEGHEYYIALFQNLNRRLKPNGCLIMALSKSCDLKEILEIAEMENMEYERVDTLKKWGETNFLYRFKLNSKVP